jgi:hypothetical protein
MTNADTDPPIRKKPNDVALAEAKSWHQGYLAAQTVKEVFVGTRHILLEAGFPDAHALCEELDQGARKWAAHEDQMRRDYRKCCKDNGIQP